MSKLEAFALCTLLERLEEIKTVVKQQEMCRSISHRKNQDPEVFKSMGRSYMSCVPAKTENL